jgi:hypothetical protein
MQQTEKLSGKKWVDSFSLTPFLLSQHTLHTLLCGSVCRTEENISPPATARNPSSVLNNQKPPAEIALRKKRDKKQLREKRKQC